MKTKHSERMKARFASQKKQRQAIKSTRGASDAAAIEPASPRCPEGATALRQILFIEEPSESLWCNQKEFAINWEDPIEFMERIAEPDFDARAADTKTGHTPLMMAARFGHLDCVRALLPKSDPNAQQQWGIETDHYFRDKTALHIAVEQGHVEVARLLAPVSDLTLACHCQSQWQWATPLELAVLNGKHEMVKLLAPLGPRTVDDLAETTPLTLAVEMMDAEAIRLLIPFCDARGVVGNGFTALMRAANDGYAEGLRLLIPVSDVKAKNGRGESALHLAAYFGDWLGDGSCGPCADILAPHADRSEVDEIFAKKGAARMPHWAARLERDALAAEIAPSQAAMDAADALSPRARVCDAASMPRRSPNRM